MSTIKMTSIVYTKTVKKAIIMNSNLKDLTHHQNDHICTKSTTQPHQFYH